jgi:hypothetical protein
LAQKANKDQVFTMANMGQDIKTAMTGGSVAVVGANAVLEENLVNGAVTPKKTDFFSIEKSVNYLDVSTVLMDYYIDTGGNIVANTSYFVTDYIDVSSDVGKVLYFSYRSGTSRLSQTIQRLATYSADKTKITQTASNIATYTIPEGVHYIRVSLSKSRISSDPMLEFDSLHSYEPYFNNAYLIDEHIKGYDDIKNVVNSLATLKYSKNGDSFFVYLKSPKSSNYTRYTFSRFINASYSIDYWRITNVSIVDQYLSVVYSVCPGYEVECAVQIGAEEFTGGYHGYENTISFETYIDGRMLDLSQSTIAVTSASEIKFVVTSTINKYGTATPAFTHTKLDVFGEGKFKTYNRLKALTAHTDVKAELGLFSIEKMNGSTPIIDRYNDNYNLISAPTPANGSVGGTVISSTNITAVDIFGSSLVVKSKIGDNSKKNYKGILSDFTNRLKIYLRPVDNYNIALNEEIFCNSEFVVYD